MFLFHKPNTVHLAHIPSKRLGQAFAQHYRLEPTTLHTLNIQLHHSYWVCRGALQTKGIFKRTGGTRMITACYCS